MNFKMNANYKITQHTNDTVRIVAAEGYHFETPTGEFLGKVIYDGIGVRVEEKYKVLLDNYLKPF